MCLTITSLLLICSFSSLDQKRMTELVSYLTRQRAHTPQEKVDNKQKPKEVRCSEVSLSFSLLTCFYIFVVISCAGSVNFDTFSRERK